MLGSVCEGRVRVHRAAGCVGGVPVAEVNQQFVYLFFSLVKITSEA